jgi:hypothetical protein
MRSRLGTRWVGSTVVALLVAIAAPVQAETLDELNKVAAKLDQEVDQQLQWYLRYQVQAGWYRSRLKLLQSEWQQLLGRPIPQPKKYPPPPAQGLRVDELLVSDAVSFRQARLTPSCKRKNQCRFWLRIALSKALAAKAERLEVSATLQHTKQASRRYVVRPKTQKIAGSVMIVQLPLSRAKSTIGSGPYQAKVRVLAGGRTKHKTLELTLGLR